jgi:hypothetical protein
MVHMLNTYRETGHVASLGEWEIDILLDYCPSAVQQVS